jgi:hypothetical protein
MQCIIYDIAYDEMSLNMLILKNKFHIRKRLLSY